MQSLFSQLSEEKVHIIIVIKEIARCEDKYQEYISQLQYSKILYISETHYKTHIGFFSVEITGIAQRLDLADIYLSNEFMKHTFDAL